MLTCIRERLLNREPINVVIYGDSISEVGRTPGWNGGATSPELNWGSQLVRLLNEAFPGQTFVVKHFGIGGQNTYEGLGRADWLAGLEPHLVLVEFGANDCGWHFIPPDATALALRSLVENIRVCHQADVVVMGMAGDNPQQPTMVHLKETRTVQREIAAELNAPYVDLRAAVLAATEDGLRWTDYHNDITDCHPNDRGHAVWAAAAMDVLQPLLEALSTEAGVY